MTYIVAFVLAIINSMLIDNVILSRFYGICPFMGVSKKTSSSIGMGVAVILVIFVGIRNSYFYMISFKVLST